MSLLRMLLPYLTLDRILAILAIIFATKQFFDARKTDEKMRDHSRKMQDIGKSMSTRFIGTFPENMPEIKSVVADAKQRLDVMVDYLGYGHFSSPAIFSEYKNLLLSKHNDGVDIRIIVYGDNLLLKSNASEFPADQYESLKKTDEYADFFHINRGLEAPSDPKDFRELLIERQQTYLREALVAGIPIRTVSHELIIFLWLEDAEDAVFSFRGAGIKNDREVAFRTRDGKLIDTFRGLFEKVWNDATPINLLPSSSSTAPVLHRDILEVR